jgi:GH18 family chitinase
LLVLGNYPGYATSSLSVADIPYHQLTHVSYFSLSPSPGGDLDVTHVDVADLEALAARAHAKGVKTLVTVGGWGRSTYFSTMAADSGARANFAARLTQYCLDHGLDGVDLDWEPVSSAIDRVNYSLLVQALRNEFDPVGLLLAVSVSAYGHEITPQAIDLVDWLNVMAYDGPPPHHSTFDFALSALGHWEDYGTPRAKLMLGLPFYGKSAGNMGYSYRQIVEAFHPEPDTDFVGGIGFNGIETIREKTAYVLDNGYRGVMIWELSQDAPGDSSLMTAIADTIMAGLPANFDGNDAVDLHDFRVLGSAWRSDPNDGGWNPLCDISEPKDEFIDGHDLVAFCWRWLTGR